MNPEQILTQLTQEEITRKAQENNNMYFDFVAISGFDLPEYAPEESYYW